MSTMREMGPVEAENQELRKRVAELELEALRADSVLRSQINVLTRRAERAEALVESARSEIRLLRPIACKALGAMEDASRMAEYIEDYTPGTDDDRVIWSTQAMGLNDALDVWTEQSGPTWDWEKGGKSTPAPAPNLDLVREARACLDTLQDKIERGRDPDGFNAAWSSLRNLLQVFLNEVDVAGALVTTDAPDVFGAAPEFDGATERECEPAMVRCEECGDSWPADQGLGCDCKERIERQQAERA